MAGRVFERNGTFYIAWYVRGVEYKRSAHTPSRAVAEKLLLKAIRKSGTGHVPTEDNLTFEALIEKVRLDREVRGRRCNDLGQRAAKLKPFFANMRAVDISTESVEQYVTTRLRDQAAHATVNRELALLRRAFHLAELTRKPRIQLLPENNARQDFLDWADFQAVRAELPEWARDVVTFMYLSSWRSGQVVAMEWRDIDMREHVATARGETTKSGEPHRIALVGELWEIIERAFGRGSLPIKTAGSLDREGNKVQTETQSLGHSRLIAPSNVGNPPRPILRRLDCPYVFHRDGVPFLLRGSKSPLRKAWNAACAAAGFSGHVLHCLRRSGVRNMIGAGVDPMLAMQVSGHKTMAMLSRYRIVDLKDQQRGLEKMMTYLAEQPSEGKVRAIGGTP
jgi:integrase